MHPTCFRLAGEPDVRPLPKTHMAPLAKRRERVVGLSSSYRPCRFFSWESEELDDRPHALLPAARRKSLSP